MRDALFFLGLLIFIAMVWAIALLLCGWQPMHAAYGGLGLAGIAGAGLAIVLGGARK